jgi:hypothetical protein
MEKQFSPLSEARLYYCCGGDGVCDGSYDGLIPPEPKLSSKSSSIFVTYSHERIGTDKLRPIRSGGPILARYEDGNNFRSK